MSQPRKTSERVCPQCATTLEWPAYADVVVCASCKSTLAADAAMRAIQCPQCAGPLAAVGELRMLACCHCGIHVLVSSRGGHDRWRLPLRIEAREAQTIARNWLHCRDDIVRPPDDLLFTTANLVYLPVWEYSALVAGWEFGLKTRVYCQSMGDEQSERLELQTVREEIEEGRLQERRFYEAAADPRVLGASRPRITGREPLLPLIGGDMDDAQVLLSAGSIENILARGRRRALRPTSAVEHAQGRLSLIRESVCLLQYPLWMLEAHQGSVRYSVVVNGYEGSVNAAVAPAGLAGEIKRRISALAPLGALALVLLVLALVSPGSRLAALTFFAIVLVGTAVLLFAERRKSEVHYHDPYSS